MAMETPDLTESYEIYDENYNDASFNQLHHFYAETVLGNVRSSEVVSALIEYVTTIIEPVGWNAIWKVPRRSTTEKGELQFPSGCQFLVMVLDVSMKKLQASVKVLKLLCHGDYKEPEETMFDQWLADEVQVNVPLVQLFPLRDEEGIFTVTAQAVHTVRFFYENIWRPWDDDDDDKGSFVEKHLSTRLKFYFELKNDCLPESVKCQTHDILMQATEIQANLEELQGQITLSDSEEEELDEEDVRKCVQLRMRMEKLQREMEILENPLLRNLCSNNGMQERRQSNRNEEVVHIVSERLTVGMIKNLPLDAEKVVEIHRTVESALSAAVSGDSVLIFPGHYKMGLVPWLEQNLTIRGLGEAGEVVLEAGDGCGDLFISCTAQFLTLSNLELVPSAAMHATVMVHEGHVAIEHCVLRGAKNSLVVLESVDVQLRHCQIVDSQGDAIQLRPGSKCSLSDCSIFNSSGSAVRVSNHLESNTTQTQLSLEDCKLNNNGHFAIVVECSADKLVLQQTVTWDHLHNLPFLNLTEKSVSMDRNGKGNLGVSLQGKSPTPNSGTGHQSISLFPPRIKFPSLSDSSDDED